MKLRINLYIIVIVINKIVKIDDKLIYLLIINFEWFKGLVIKI